MLLHSLIIPAFWYLTMFYKENLKILCDQQYHRSKPRDQIIGLLVLRISLSFGKIYIANK